MDGTALIDQLYDLLAAAEPVPFAGDDVYVAPDDYGRIRGQIVAAGRQVGDERVAELLDGLETIPLRDAPRTARRRIDRAAVTRVLYELRELLPTAERAAEATRSAPHAQHVELDDPGAPTLEALVERVERDHARFLISRGGTLLADLVPPDDTR